MKKKKKKYRIKAGRVFVLFGVIVVIVGMILFYNRKKLQVITVVEEIGGYHYTLASNATRLYKKYFKELERELKDNKIDEENYASLIAQLFVIDYYTLNNKVTNKNIGGVEFIHSNLKDSFISSASATIYKYVENNLYGNRKQKLPEVNDVQISSIQPIQYQKKGYEDNSGYQVEVSIGYVHDYDYPNKVTLSMIHEENKLVIVEVQS